MNQRIIKFKAWDSGRKSFEDDIINLYTIKDDYWNNYTKNKVFLQFTGLLDKNGKEIYEGDIFEITKMKFYTGWKKYLTVVEWSERMASFGVVLNPRSSLKGAEKRWKNLSWAVNRRERGHSAEIIGNIYENPNLLTPQPHEQYKEETEEGESVSRNGNFARGSI
jgi:uncharacterized phage protein (TIGR01671 family)